MRALGFTETLAQWLASSLVPVPGGGPSGGLTWAFDIKGDTRCSRAEAYKRSSAPRQCLRPHSSPVRNPECKGTFVAQKLTVYPGAHGQTRGDTPPASHAEPRRCEWSSQLPTDQLQGCDERGLF